MKKFQFLALKNEEFFDMVSKISRERSTLKQRKRTDKIMKLICFMVIPASIITFKVEEENNHINVTRTINFLPVLLLSIPILAALEAIVYGISTLVNNFSVLTFILVGSAWIMVVIFLIYQTFVEVDEINKRLYRVEL
ncbi:MAG: hypothetical protein ACTSQ4_08520 [Candidatus Heimdallarchaeaceae archaeon]